MRKCLVSLIVIPLLATATTATAQQSDDTSAPTATDSARQKASDARQKATESAANATGTEAGAAAVSSARDAADRGHGPDPAWQTFHEAFLSLARGETLTSSAQLLDLRRLRPNHPASVFARPVLDMFRNRMELPDGTIPPKSEWMPIEQHPAVQNRQSDVYDPAWAHYREAFVELVARRGNRARAKLQSVAEKYPDHTAGGYADEALETLEARAEEIARKERERKEDHEATDSPVPSRAGAAPPGARVAAEFGGALVGGLGGGLGGGLVGAGLGALAGGPWAMIGGSIVGAGLGGVILYPAGTHFGGNLADGRGDLGWTYLGTLIGMGGGALLSAAAPPASPVLFPLLSFTGTIGGYEISHQNNVGSRHATGGPTVRPFVTPARLDTPRLLGVDVRF